MNSLSFDRDDGGKVVVESDAASAGNGHAVTERMIAADGSTESVTVTCTCWDSAGNKYSTTKQCPKEGNTCDCSTPSSPTITCS